MAVTWVIGILDPASVTEYARFTPSFASRIFAFSVKPSFADTRGSRGFGFLHRIPAVEHPTVWGAPVGEGLIQRVAGLCSPLLSRSFAISNVLALLYWGSWLPTT